tara:strand:- start:304 stop:423 length:120 start_codon:yes stop_codon:yes gene_type:complete
MNKLLKFKKELSVWSLYWRFEIILVSASFVVGFVLGLFI